MAERPSPNRLDLSDDQDLPEWLVDLVVQRATEGLEDVEQHRVDVYLSQLSLQARANSEAAIDRIELAAAAIDLNYGKLELHESHNSSVDGPTPMLKLKLRDGARDYFLSQPAVVACADNPVDERNMLASRRPSLTKREVFSWMTAAASVAVLMTGWNPFANVADRNVAERTATGKSIPPVVISNDQKLEQLIADSPADLIEQAWTATNKNDDASGKVIWSDSAQAGFMVFDGLRANDPKTSQYQLWIFDTDAAQEYPVDGGVFDVLSDGRVVVEIDPKIRVRHAVMFAVTEERPGGVVVSDRSRLPLLAKLD